MATLEADIAVASLLRSSVPAHIDILDGAYDLPKLMPFHINLYSRTSQTNAIVRELAGHIRDQIQRRFQTVPQRKAG